MEETGLLDEVRMPIEPQAITYEEVIAYLQNSNLDFHPTQSSISFPIIERICRRLKSGNEFSPIQIVDNKIIDGHHRYVGYNLMKKKLERVPGGANASFHKNLAWSEVDVDINDYDSEEIKTEYENKYDL